ncbi:MAG: DNA photolyase family protein [Blastocatellia bacterium]|nr:DNA photolyase family protein [Blastocatellia bacterium]
MPRTIIHWFRRDLRLTDNQALFAACQQAEFVIPVFIFDPAQPQRNWNSTNRLAFLLDSLRELDLSLRANGSFLVVRLGNPEEELDRLVTETGAVGLFVNRIVDPALREQGRRLTARLQSLGCEVRSFQDAMLHDPRHVLTQGRQPYTVFTPYKRTALSYSVAPAKPAPEQIVTPAGIRTEDIPTSEYFQVRATARTIPAGGETQAGILLDGFVADRLRRYGEGRDLPAVPGTSQLSPYLHFGCLSVRAAFHRANRLLQEASLDTAGRASVETWISELVWRDFYMQILYHFPHVEQGAFKPVYDRLVWSDNREHFERWCHGQTGFPIIDAGMRQLQETGWMHNRVRMITASFLVKDLLLNWQWGEQHFMRHLLDGNLAANNGGWQWAASTGTDAQPYFRVFNPISQGQKFDPQGVYVKRFVPELKAVPEKWIHQPWELPSEYQKPFRCRIGTDYPAPMVDHARQRSLAIEMFKEVSLSKA